MNLSDDVSQVSSAIPEVDLDLIITVLLIFVAAFVNAGHAGRVVAPHIAIHDMLDHVDVCPVTVSRRSSPGALSDRPGRRTSAVGTDGVKLRHVAPACAAAVAYA